MKSNLHWYNAGTVACLKTVAQDGCHEVWFAHADDYEPDVPVKKNTFSILFIVKLIASLAAIFAFMHEPMSITFPFAIAGFVWLVAQIFAFLLTRRFANWQRQHRQNRPSKTTS